MEKESEPLEGESVGSEPTVALKPCFISLIDEFDKPLLVYAPGQDEKEVNEVLKYNVFSNISLDYFDSPLFDWVSLESQPTVKLFFQLEGVAVFGMLIKPTGLKIIIGFPQESYNSEVHEQQIREIFQKVHKIYLKVKLNPFINLSSGSSTSREEIIQKLEAKFNVEF
ncbi:hypothetical protein ZYGR_0S01370 [Zygosaccharomyces rouxii]|uniref:ZYRO0F05544p n=2 Tax=Zygosaccharomyces rouxii TaxID=4956 RepID=C5DXJ3_ZYGRC|nr:uncharacterized protein ZYRO0F05544g [Zygosaccharomyces rouxii]KAH9199266.1 hypothetical protein LQ764DRAFT_225514 [Zygosaccharomyces rouxii]GAV50003.1 hypothetical protein ZYGR_0S01370 [Zygosaccharomyces rouxii]CAR28504.1 ZYRO0F05544p [Zygosaccharomyces rouxii]